MNLSVSVSLVLSLQQRDHHDHYCGHHHHCPHHRYHHDYHRRHPHHHYVFVTPRGTEGFVQYILQGRHYCKFIVN